MRRKYLTLVTFLALGSPSVSLSQSLEAGLPDLQTYNIVDFEIGMSANDVRQQVEASLPNARVSEGLSRHRETGQEFTSWIRVLTQDGELNFFFTGHYSGNKLYALSRRLDYPRGQGPSMEITRDAIFDKYGAPTAGNGFSLNYVFDNKTKVILADSEEETIDMIRDGLSYMDFLQISQDRKTFEYSRVNGCAKRVEDAQRLQFFKPLEVSARYSRDCSAGMNVELSGSGDVLRRLEIKLSDFNLVVAAGELDQAMAESLVVPPKPTGETPDL